MSDTLAAIAPLALLSLMLYDQSKRQKSWFGAAFFIFSILLLLPIFFIVIANSDVIGVEMLNIGVFMALAIALGSFAIIFWKHLVNPFMGLFSFSVKFALLSERVKELLNAKKNVGAENRRGISKKAA